MGPLSLPLQPVACGLTLMFVVGWAGAPGSRADELKGCPETKMAGGLSRPGFCWREGAGPVKLNAVHLHLAWAQRAGPCPSHAGGRGLCGGSPAAVLPPHPLCALRWPRACWEVGALSWDTAELGEGAPREMGGKGQEHLSGAGLLPDSQTTTVATVTARAPRPPSLCIVVLPG